MPPGLGINSNQGYHPVNLKTNNNRGSKRKNSSKDSSPSSGHYAKYNNMMPKHDNASKSTTTSDSDSSAHSDLSGFKIVHDGKVIHDETEDEVENLFNYGDGNKYASSVLTVGPNAQSISLPSFLDS